MQSLFSMLTEGKTKIIFKCKDENLVRIVFKDNVTGQNGIPDSGGNEVVGELKGKAESSLKLSAFFFKELEAMKVPTHFVKVEGPTSMIAKKAEPLPLEFIFRRYSYGSFQKRFGGFVKEGTRFPNLVQEVSLKDDERGDPFISDTLVELFGIMTARELARAKILTLKTTFRIEKLLKDKGLELIDIKFEVGKVMPTDAYSLSPQGEVVLIDEISGDCMRVKKGDKLLNQLELAEALLSKE